MDRKPLNDPSEPFLERWSRRKREAEGSTARRPETGAVGPAGLPDELDEAPRLTDADMPPLESLGEDGDYSGFLSAGVSEELRRAALRRLFGSAKYNVTDGLDDYAEDFTAFVPLGDIVTADMKHRIQQLARRIAGEDEIGETAAATPPDDEYRTVEEAGRETGVDAGSGDGGTDGDPGDEPSRAG